MIDLKTILKGNRKLICWTVLDNGSDTLIPSSKLILNAVILRDGSPEFISTPGVRVIDIHKRIDTLVYNPYAVRKICNGARKGMCVFPGMLKSSEKVTVPVFRIDPCRPVKRRDTRELLKRLPEYSEPRCIEQCIPGLSLKYSELPVHRETKDRMKGGHPPDYREYRGRGTVLVTPVTPQYCIGSWVLVNKLKTEYLEIVL